MTGGVMMGRIFFIVVALAISWTGAFAQTPPGWAPLGGNTSISVSGTSANVALPVTVSGTAPNVRVCNTGANSAYLVFGSSSSVAATTTGGSLIASGVCSLYSPPSGSAYLAAITSSSTTTLTVESGAGNTLSSVPGGAGGVGAPMKTDASNATLPTARQYFDLTPYSPLSYGAVCDSSGTGGGTDDTSALNAMFTAIRASNKPFVVDSSGKVCYHTGTINLTGLNGFSHNTQPSVIKLRLDCRVNAGPCIDAMGSRFINFDNLYIYGEQTSGPTYGIQMGMIAPDTNADMHNFKSPFIWGYFTASAIYNLASESLLMTNPFVQNSDAGSSYGMILDGCNHWNITSAFVTETITPDSCQSFNSDTFVGGWIGGHTPLWIEGAKGAHFISGYSPGVSAGNGAAIYTSSTSIIQQLTFDNWHFEPDLADTFLITGTTNPNLEGFTYKDYQTTATNSLFKFGGSVTVGTVRQFYLDVAQMPSGTKVFDNAPQWVIITGDVFVPLASNWSGTPFLMQANLCTVDGQCTINPSTINLISGNNTALLVSPTAPTIASGGCTTGSAQSILANNGSAAFAIKLGGATCGSTITLTMPAAKTGWVCDAHDITTPASNAIDQTVGGSPTVVTLTNYARTTGLAANFTGADVLAVKCMAY